MSDEDIEFLGTKPAQKPFTHRPVTGIVLYVEKSSTNDAYRMAFNRKTSVVQIGRRPGVESGTRCRDIDSGKAMFRCAVVSRKHAKIAFSDSGHAYLIDLSSHHGTHVRKPGELLSKMLQPEIPFLLTDGDIITFGKSVGKNEECVRPVVVRIELLRNPQPSIKPLFVPSPSSDKSTSSKSSSGRYGIYMPSSSSSSDEYSSPSIDQDSDIEEIPPPTGSQSRIESASSSGFSRAFDVLKRLLPPTHTPIREQSPEIQITHCNVELAPIDVVASAENVSDSFHNSPLSSRFSPWSTHSPNLPPLDDFYPVGFDASEHDIYEPLEYKSRSHSPMDLESPSPPLPPTPPPQLLVNEPSIIGAYPAEATTNNVEDDPEVVVPQPRPSSSSIGIIWDDDGNKDREPSECVLGVDSDVTSVRPEPSPVPVVSEARPPSPTGDEACDPSKTTNVEPEVTIQGINEVKSTIEKLQLDVNRLQTHKRKYKTRFNANVRTMSSKISDFDDQIAEVDAQYTNVFEKLDKVTNVDIADLSCQFEEMQEQIENLTHVHIPDLQSQVDNIEDQVSEMLEKYDEVNVTNAKTAKLNAEMDDTLRDMIDEMKKHREVAQRQIATELEAVKTLREVIMAEISARVNAIETPVHTSLKRKRDDTDENESQSEAEVGAASVNVSSPALENSTYPAASSAELDAMMMMMMDEAPISPSIRYVEALAALDGPPPRKRMRKIASVMARTATAVTLGAVVTWSALAFS